MADDSAIAAFLSHMAAAEQDTLVVQGVVSQRTAQHRRRRLRRREIAPATGLDIIRHGQATCEINERLAWRVKDNLIEGNVEIRSSATRRKSLRGSKETALAS